MSHHEAISLSLTARATALAAACCCLAALAALATSGVGAASAVVVGGAAMGLAVSLLTRLLRALLDEPRRNARPGLRSLAGAAMRWPLTAAAVFVALRAGLPGPWIAAGVTAWPVALIVDGLAMGRGVAANQA